MALFRKIHTSFWSDSFISDLDQDKKLFYLYLLTNDKTTQCGIYEITKRQISFDLGYSIDTVSILLQYFINKGKIMYNEGTKEVAVKNWLKYNGSTSPKVQQCINKDLTSIKDRVLIEYLYSMDTASQEEQEQEQEKEIISVPSKFNFKKAFIDLGVDPEILSDWLQVRSKKKAANTKTAFNSIKNEIESSGLTANDCIKMAAEKSWMGFKAEWIHNQTGSTSKQQPGKIKLSA